MTEQQSATKSLLRARNLKATPTRVGLLQVISAYNAAMPYSAIQSALKGTDRITLYRTLNKLLEKGIIHKAHTTTDETYYAMCGATCTDEAHYHNHVHFRCTTCQAVTCESLPQEVSLTLPNFTIDSVHISLTGVCKNCKD